MRTRTGGSAAGGPRPGSRTALLCQFELERELAARLRAAPKSERWRLYGPIYEEFFRRLPDQPQLALKSDVAAQIEQAHLQIQLLEPFLSGVETFLEVGSGDGSLVRSLAERVPRLYAVEASEIIAAGDEPPPNLEILWAKDVRIGLPDASIDLAFSCHFVEHLHPDDLPDHLIEVRRVLRPGAPYLCVTPNRLYGPHDVSGAFTETPQGLHLREYTHRELGRVLRRAGFARVRALCGVGRPPVLWPLLPLSILETVAGAVPRRLRRKLLPWLLRTAHAPLRPLEQVKLAAWS